VAALTPTNTRSGTVKTVPYSPQSRFYPASGL